MGNNINPTAGEGVLRPKNANCEGGVKPGIYTFCPHIIDSHGTQYTTGISKIYKENVPRCRSTPKSRFECRGSGPAFVEV